MAKPEFEERKEAALCDAKSLGIIDDMASADAFSRDTLELAIKLVEEYAPAVYREIEERRKSQK